MRLFPATVAILALSACSHIQYVRSDNSQKTVTLQGGRYDLLSDIQDSAEKYCQKPSFKSMQIANDDKKSDKKSGANEYLYNFSCLSMSASQN